MRPASAGTIALLATHNYYVAECYDWTIFGTTYRYTAYDRPLTVGGNTYLTGMTIARGSLHQKVGLEVQTLELNLAPQADAGGVTIAGYPLLQAVRLGIFDGIRINFSKIYMPAPADTSNGLTAWWTGRVSEANAGRANAKLTVSTDLILLNVQMPRNLFQVGCVHVLFDAGCTLNPATFVIASSVSTLPGANTMTTPLTQADGYFALGRLVMTSGLSNGWSSSVSAYANASGLLTLNKPFPVVAGITQIAPGDTFNVYPGCDKQQSTCATKFLNAGGANGNHFRGYRFLPVPETMYAGGTTASDVPGTGRQGATPGGSASSAGWHHTTYQR